MVFLVVPLMRVLDASRVLVVYFSSFSVRKLTNWKLRQKSLWVRWNEEDKEECGRAITWELFGEGTSGSAIGSDKNTDEGWKAGVGRNNHVCQGVDATALKWCQLGDLVRSSSGISNVGAKLEVLRLVIF